MLDELALWPDKLQAGRKKAELYYAVHQQQLPTSVREVLFVGMGGSGIAGRIIALALERHRSVQARIIEGVAIPEFDPLQTIAIVCSYSGNTWETLAVYEQLCQQNIPTICITHGGQLAEQSANAVLPPLMLDASKTPRSALGQFLGTIAGLLGSMGLFSGETFITRGLKSIESTAPIFSDPAYFSEFCTLAKGKGQFFVWGVAGDSDVIARRAQTQFNENSKIAAVYSQFPELAHNLLVGMADSAQNGALALIMSTPLCAPALKNALFALDEVLQASGVRLYKPNILGDTWEEQLFHGILWADYASCHLGRKRGVALEPVDAIDSYKMKLQQYAV